jgi:hypothetical protein
MASQRAAAEYENEEALIDFAAANSFTVELSLPGFMQRPFPSNHSALPLGGVFGDVATSFDFQRSEPTLLTSSVFQWSEPTLLCMSIMDVLQVTGGVLDSRLLKRYVQKILIRNGQEILNGNKDRFQFLNYLSHESLTARHMFIEHLDIKDDNEAQYFKQRHVKQMLAFFFVPPLAFLLENVAEDDIRRNTLLKALMSISRLTRLFAYYEFYFFLMHKLNKHKRPVRLVPRAAPRRLPAKPSQPIDAPPVVQVQTNSSTPYIIDSAREYLSQHFEKNRAFFASESSYAMIDLSTALEDCHVAKPPALEMRKGYKALKADLLFIINEEKAPESRPRAVSYSIFWTALRIFMESNAFHECVTKIKKEVSSSEQRIVSALCGQLAVPFFAEDDVIQSVRLKMGINHGYLRNRVECVASLKAKALVARARPRAQGDAQADDLHSDLRVYEPYRISVYMQGKREKPDGDSELFDHDRNTPGKKEPKYNAHIKDNLISMCNTKSAMAKSSKGVKKENKHNRKASHSKKSDALTSEEPEASASEEPEASSSEQPEALSSEQPDTSTSDSDVSGQESENDGSKPDDTDDGTGEALVSGARDENGITDQAGFYVSRPAAVVPAANSEIDAEPEVARKEARQHSHPLDPQPKDHDTPPQPSKQHEAETRFTRQAMIKGLAIGSSALIALVVGYQLYTQPIQGKNKHRRQ